MSSFQPVTRARSIEHGHLPRQFSRLNEPRNLDSRAAALPIGEYRISDFSIENSAEIGAVQSKLRVSTPGDPLEEEADSVAEQVVSGASPSVLAVPGEEMLQRNCSGCEGGAPCPECEEEEKKGVQRKAVEASSTTNGHVPSNFLADLGQGVPMEPETLEFMESRFARDFHGVRIHRGEMASSLAETAGALAFTVGRDVVFGAGKYDPETIEGRRLLSHELAHVVQQGASPDSPSSPRLGHTAAPQHDKEMAPSAAFETRKSAKPELRISPQMARQKTANAQEGKGGQQNVGCAPAAGIPPTDCSAYAKNASWLPSAYVTNATCACEATPNEPSANCVRKSLQDRLAATPAALKVAAVVAKPNDDMTSPVRYAAYQAFVQTALTPRIYRDHVDAYKSCCCPSGPAAYPAWMGVTLVPIPSCSTVGSFINRFGSCHGTPGAW